MAHILVVEDDVEQLELRRLILEQFGHTVSSASSASEAMTLWDQFHPKLTVMDLRLPKAEDGLALIRSIKDRDAGTHILLLSGVDPEGITQLPEAKMVDQILRKPVCSAQLMQLVSKLAVLLICFLPVLSAQTNKAYTVQVDAPSEVVADFELSAPGADWGRAGREGALAVLTVDDAKKQNIMVFSGSAQHHYSVLLGELAAGSHTVKIERHPDYSSRGIQFQVHDCKFKSYKPGDADYDVIANAPFLYARPNTVGKFTDIPLLAYAERLGDGSLQYTIIFSNEDGGTSTRALMARWGRATDIEYLYRVFPDKSGKPLKGIIQTRDHKDAEFRGKKENNHPLLMVVTDNNLVADEGSSAIRYQLAPFVTSFNTSSREKAMDENPITYLISARELEREEKLRQYGTIEGSKISNPENYLFVEMRLLNKDARVAVLVKLQDENFFRSSNIGVHDMGIERSGWARTAIELPPATQPGLIAEIAFQCLPEPRTDGKGSCRIEALGKLFFLNAKQQPDQNFWQPKMDRGPWILAPGQMRIVQVR